MNPENASILGYVLLLVGVALTIIGYVVYLNLRGDKGGANSEDDQDEAQVSELESISDEPEAVSEADDEAPLQETNTSSSDVDDGDEPEEMEEPDEEGDVKGAYEISSMAPKEHELIPAATLFREGVTGQIIVQVGERQYSDIKELKLSKDWDRIKSLSSDLTNWIEERSASEGSRTDREATEHEQTQEAKGSVSDSMIFQINEIINQKVQMMDDEEREIKLVEGDIGSLEVRVGVEKFPIDEVPYENVRELIQEAVTQWENSQ